MAYKCIDISYFQGNDGDIQQAKDSGIDGCIMRVGQIENGVTSPDSTWEGNIAKANACGIHAGGYYTSGAESLAMAQEEVDFLISRLQGHTIDMPVYIDLEEDVEFLKQNVNDVIQVYADALTNAGYKPGVYSYYEWYTQYIDEERWKDIALWIAQNPVMTFQPNYFGMWQYGKEMVPGFADPVDVNELYVPYWEDATLFEVPIAETVNQPPVYNTESVLSVGVSYEVYVEGQGWQPTSMNGYLAGTTGQSLSLQKFRIRLTGADGKDLHIRYKGQIQDVGWTDWVQDGAEIGVAGNRIEGIQIELIGADADKYDVNFRSHIQNEGTLGWATDGELSGSEGGSLRLEALAVIIVPQGVDLGIDGIETFDHIVKQTPEQLAVDPDVINPVDNGDGYGKYFTPLEFACDCIKGYDIPAPCDGYPGTQYGSNPDISPRLLEVFNNAREKISAPICITCGTRCPSCNSYWGGVPDSCHLIGDAADSYCPSMDAVDYAWFLSNNYPDIGVRVYPNSGFVHIEVNTSLAGSGVYNQEGYYFM